MKKTLSLFLKLFLFFALVFLIGGFYYLYTRIEKLTDEITSGGIRNITLTQNSAGENIAVQSQECSESCRQEVERIVSQAIATLSATKTIVTTNVQSPKTAYIQMGTTHTTTQTGWTLIDDTGVYIDLENEYGKNAKVSWEASLKVAHGNGKAFARLYDDTHKIAVDFSELSTENNSSFKQVSSSDLPFWRGRNLYKVQIKSLNSFEISYMAGRIKISY